MCIACANSRKLSSKAISRERALPLPAKPSIAVLPFTNMSADTEPDFFADGLTEDLITELSKAPGLFIIARHSTFTYKGKSADVRAIARDLSVRYVLEGSARRSAGRIRINAQLIDAHEGGGHLWAERFDRDLPMSSLCRTKLWPALWRPSSAGLPPASCLTGNHPRAWRLTISASVGDFCITEWPGRKKGRRHVCYSKRQSPLILITPRPMRTWR